MLPETDLNIASSLINRYSTISIIITIIIITNFSNTHNTMQV